MRQLALGIFFPTLKTHLGYGIVFGSLRVGYHTGLVYLIYTEFQTEPVYWLLPSIPLVMHLVWFKEWVDKYGRKAITF
jgi:hypothetical protein